DRRVVDVDRSLAKRPERIGHTIELGLCQKPSVQALGVDLGLLCQQAFGELFLRHLEAEDGDRLLRFKCGMQPDVESERSVVDEDVLRHEIASLWNREVINLVLAGRDDRNDLIPIDLVTGELRKPAVAQDVRVIRKAALRDAAGPMRIEATMSGASFARKDGELSNCQSASLC